MTDKEIINNEKYHTCGRCKYENAPDDKYPCVSCIYGTDHRTDLWELKQESEVKMKMSNFEDIKAYDVPTNGSIFLKTYPDSHVSNIAYDDGVCYVYVDLGGSRTRFTSDWWNATYKEACRTERN